MWPATECFRDPVPISRDLFLCAHAPRDRFGLYVIDRFGNRELLYMDPTIDSMGATLLRRQTPPPSVPAMVKTAPHAEIGAAVSREGETDTRGWQPLSAEEHGELVLTDVSRGLEPTVPRGSVKWLRVTEEVRHDISMEPNLDHTDFMKWYASPVDVVSGPYGWPSYVAKAPLGLVRVEEDGSARFKVPAGKVVYFQALDHQYNELQRMRSVVQLQPGETRSCIGCHESRNQAALLQRSAALRHDPQSIVPHPWGDGPFSYERVVQPVLDAKCVQCHGGSQGTEPSLTASPSGKALSPLDLTGTLDGDKVPASYRTLISGGWVHVVDCGWNSAGCEKREPLTFGTVQSKLWKVLGAGHHDVQITEEEMLRLKTWTDLNCPLWPDYVERTRRVARR
jgi:mono/diheme cytochrome c family protein